MRDLILFVLATAGAVRFVSHADLTRPVRDAWDVYLAPHLPEPLRRGPHCGQCLGAWCGLAMAPLTLGSDPGTLAVAWFAGQIAGSGLGRLYAVADAYVLASRSDH